MPGLAATFSRAMHMTTTNGSESAVVEMTDENFTALTERSPVPVLVDFTAAWCAPCRAIGPHVEAIARDYQGRVRVGTVDVEANPRLGARFEVRGLPTLLLFKDGQVVGQLVGAVSRGRIEALVARALG
jgi:thioredoxin 1